MIKEPRTKNQEPRTKNQEPGPGENIQCTQESHCQLSTVNCQLSIESHFIPFLKKLLFYLIDEKNTRNRQ